MKILPNARQHNETFRAYRQRLRKEQVWLKRYLTKGTCIWSASIRDKRERSYNAIKHGSIGRKRVEL